MACVQRHRAKTNGMSQIFFMVPDGRVSIEPNHEYQLFIQFLGMSMILTQWIFFTVLHSRTHLDDMVGTKSGLNPPKTSTQNILGFLLRYSKDINTGLFHPTKSRRFMCLYLTYFPVGWADVGHKASRWEGAMKKLFILGGRHVRCIPNNNHEYWWWYYVTSHLMIGFPNQFCI